MQAPAVRAQQAAPAEFPDLPTETPCFRIDRFALEVPQDLPEAARTKGASALPQDPFAFARAWLDHYNGACIGKQSVDLLTKGVSQAILSRGYVTTRVLLPQQDLSTGTMRFVLVPGMIGQIRFAQADVRGTWKSAFPSRPGDLLNLRDLEQGLEQMKRVASQDVDMQIVPTEVPGVSDVVISVKRAKPWTVVAAVDNSGTRSTGKLQGNLSLSLDNPLGLNDLFNVGYSQDLDFSNKGHGTHGWNGFYSVPWGYWTATVSAYSSTYFQQIAGVNQTFVSSGNSQNFDVKLQRVIERSQNDVLGAQFRLSKRFGKNFVDDTEIPQQRRNNTVVETGLTDRHYFGAAQFDGQPDAASRRGRPGRAGRHARRRRRPDLALPHAGGGRQSVGAIQGGGATAAVCDYVPRAVHQRPPVLDRRDYHRQPLHRAGLRRGDVADWRSWFLLAQ